MKKVVVYSIFLILCLLIIAMFITSTSYTQLAIATLLYPPLVFFAFKYLPNDSYRINTAQSNTFVPIPQATVKNIPVPKRDESVKPDGDDVRPVKGVEIIDIDKRTFLKLIGAAGFSFFLFSMLTRKVESLIMGDNKKEETTQLQPDNDYKISEIDSDGEFNYYGFIKKSGEWYIMKEDSDVGSYRYTKGNDVFPKYWSGRNSLKYDYFSNVFN